MDKKDENKHNGSTKDYSEIMRLTRNNVASVSSANNIPKVFVSRGFSEVKSKLTYSNGASTKLDMPRSFLPYGRKHLKVPNVKFDFDV